jgi:hypothetical protein
LEAEGSDVKNAVILSKHCEFNERGAVEEPRRVFWRRGKACTALPARKGRIRLAPSPEPKTGFFDGASLVELAMLAQNDRVFMAPRFASKAFRPLKARPYQSVNAKKLVGKD